MRMMLMNVNKIEAFGCERYGMAGVFNIYSHFKL